MLLRRRLLHAALAVGLVFFASACDSADRLQAPLDAAPQFGKGNGKDAPGLIKKEIRELSKMGAPGKSDDDTFDREGGELAVTASDGNDTYTHILLVGRNAVKDATFFEMKFGSNNILSVDLYATTVGSQEYNDAGKNGFRHPPTLCLDIGALDISDRGKDLALAWDMGGGEFKRVPSSRYKDKKGATDYLCGNVDHFSRFVVIHN